MNAVIVLTGVLTTSLVAGVGNSIALDTVQKNYEDLEKINSLYVDFRMVYNLPLVFISTIYELWLA
jgi:hypothetical protein